MDDNGTIIITKSFSMKVSHAEKIVQLREWLQLGSDSKVVQKAIDAFYAAEAPKHETEKSG